MPSPADPRPHRRTDALRSPLPEAGPSGAVANELAMLASLPKRPEKPKPAPPAQTTRPEP